MQQAQQSPHPDKESTVKSAGRYRRRKPDGRFSRVPSPAPGICYRVPASRMFLRTMAIAMQTNAATRNR
jgi:hypothetical protein